MGSPAPYKLGSNTAYTYSLLGAAQLIMRHNISKRKSSKAERVMYEILKELHIPFRHRWLIHGHEIDFLVNKLAIEINGHEQDIEKNRDLIEHGYSVVHFTNKYIYENRDTLKQTIIKLL